VSKGYDKIKTRDVPHLLDKNTAEAVTEENKAMVKIRTVL
jgi:hypothetical protein